MQRMRCITNNILGREIRTITRRYNYLTKWKFTHSSSLWKLTLVRICSLRFIGAWKSSENQGITVRDNSYPFSRFYMSSQLLHTTRYVHKHLLSVSNIVAYVLLPYAHLFLLFLNGRRDKYHRIMSLIVYSEIY